MGFLDSGSTLLWEEASTKPTEYVREHGITQFLNIYRDYAKRNHESLRWGDEIEYIVVCMDKENHTTKLCLRGHEILDKLSKQEEGIPGKDPQFLWRPEYARYMVEGIGLRNCANHDLGTPGAPYGARGLDSLIEMQGAMESRRQALENALDKSKGEEVVSLTNFPLLGAIQYGPYTEPQYEPGGPVALSLFTPDKIIHPHYRFSTLTANIRKRRGSKVEINVPLFIDTHTPADPIPLPHIPSNPSAEYLDHRIPSSKPYNIYMDSMAFGMGMCCLQVTFQCCNINEARQFYDQLAVMSPIMLAVTAATPIFRGYLADVDARWDTICASVDDRTEEERGLKPLHNNKFVINKSRYASIDCYIAKDSKLKPHYNDINLVYDKDICQHLLDQGIDELLARHIAHLFIRDPLVIYKDKIAIDDETHSDHFENIQSTNWQTVRFKPPPPGADIGWRVEFRPMEIQLTDFENAAYSLFIVLLTRVLGAFDLNLYIPLSKVDENLAKAHKRGALTNEKFYFRKNLNAVTKTDGEEYELMTINEIMNGKTLEGGEKFIGLVELMNVYLDTVNVSKETREKITIYLNFISKKASGELVTTATYLRHEVLNHPDYKKDSAVTPRIAHDLVQKCIKIGHGELHPKDLYGDFAISPQRKPAEKKTVSESHVMKEEKIEAKVSPLWYVLAAGLTVGVVGATYYFFKIAE